MENNTHSLCNSDAITEAVAISTPRALVARSSCWFSISALLLVAACGGSAGTEEQITENRPPSIFGSPPTIVSDGDLYDFAPSAIDPDGDSLVFDIDAKPSWAIFDTATGRLNGQPTTTDIGQYDDILINASDGRMTSSLPAFSIVVAARVTNSAPTISGRPENLVLQDTPYSFTPVTNDSDGDSLTFDIAGQPTWTTFDNGTGTLAGLPEQGDVGDYSDIIISVSDGQATSSLDPFAITVTAATSGSVTLDWTAPTTNADGSPLDDLSGYVIYWGTAPTTYSQSARIYNPVTTSYVLSSLTADTYYFVIAAVDLAGNQSAYSNSFNATIP